MPVHHDDQLNGVIWRWLRLRLCVTMHLLNWQVLLSGRMLYSDRGWQIALPCGTQAAAAVPISKLQLL